MHENDDFSPLRETAECARPPSPKSVTPSENQYLVIVNDKDLESVKSVLETEGHKVVHPYVRFPILELSATPENADFVSRDPRIAGVYPALGSLDQRRTLALGFDAVAVLADAQNHQTSAQPFGGRRAGDPAGYPILIANGERWEVDLDASLDWPAPPALVPVVNFSVGPKSASHPVIANDIVNIATLMATRSVLVVAAAGNCGGLGENTMSAWACPEWVLAVGAASDEDGTTLADYSSRGEAGVADSGPDLVAYGRSEVPPHPLGTSFAAPRVTRLARLVTAAMAQLGRSIRVSNGAADHGVPLVGSAIIDDFGDGLTHSDVDHLLIPALPILGVEQSLIKEHITAASQGGRVPDIRITPTWLKAFLLSCATQMPGYGPHEVGHGFIDRDRVIDRLCRVTLAEIDGWFGQDSQGTDHATGMEGRPFIKSQLLLLDGLLRQTGPSVHYDYVTQRIALIPAHEPST